MTSFCRFRRDEAGSVLVEAAMIVPIMILITLGAIDCMLAFYQYTAAAKAVQIGARLAAVSDPVASGLTGTIADPTNIATAAVSSTVLLGDPMPDFELTCTSSGCTCSRGSCYGLTGYSSAALNTIVYGRGSSSCTDATSVYTVGMCDIFNRITPANVQIVYSQTGLGFAGRTAGPVPTITVSLRNMSYQFIFLGNLPGFSSSVSMPGFSTTITGEGLTSGGVS
jgi:hypothetical protein